MVSRSLKRCALFPGLLVACWTGSWAPSASAQTIGTFRWQAVPFCNIVELTVVQVGTVFSLEGFDDQCGAATRASVVGTAFFNPDGTVGVGLTTIATPGGVPVHMDVALSLTTIGGPWRDSAGNLGTFVFTPGASAGGNPRPLGRGLGAAAIDPTQVQRRVNGTCLAGSAVRSVNEDGTVNCESAVNGDISAVTAGAGLTGGAASGEAILNVHFAGSGSASTAARSDHDHRADGLNNTAVGQVALAVNSSGSNNTAAGSGALVANTTGSFNTAVGTNALRAINTGASNTAIGDRAGQLSTGSSNTFVGAFTDTIGGGLVNATAIGANARVNASNALVLGSIAGIGGATQNVRVGIGTTAPEFPLHVVGANGVTGRIQVGTANPLFGSNRRLISFGDADGVYVGEEDADNRLVLAGDSGIRFKANLGASVAPQLDNLNLLGTPGNRWSAVYAVNGTIQTSDARLKDRIADLDHGLAEIMRLRPVHFHWKGSSDAGLQLGLLAQDVERVIPEAVVHGATPDEPLGLNYSSLVPVLIKAIQEQEAARQLRDARIDVLAREISALREQLTQTSMAMRK